ncbi:MAG: sodium-dependent transporter [Clostridia bacterium]|nr:sodium-dependent transporter [Clostridia bacterium]
MKREGFRSRLGFLLVSAGCAIGIGNVWKFPYVAGENGGGVFLLFYLLFLAAFGTPLLSMELAVGRAGRGSAVNALKTLESQGQKWHLLGWMGLLGCYLLMMFYTTVSGWMLCYFFRYATGYFDGLSSAAAIRSAFYSLLNSPFQMIFWLILIIVAGFMVCGKGIAKGLERVTKPMMIALLILLIILVINSLTLDKAAEGLSYYLLPDFEKAASRGLGKVISAAMSQAFFTLSIGLSSMQIFGSYMSDERTIVSESVRICALDTFVAVSAGLIIFPACFTYGIEPSSGPSLIFEALPNVFANMPAGRLWGTLFYLFMTFASFSTITAVFQNIVAGCTENLGWSKKKALTFNTVALTLLSLPCVFGFNKLSHISITKIGNILSIEDFIVSNMLLPVGCLAYLLFCVYKEGWGFDSFINEANRGGGICFPSSKGFRFYLGYILPLAIVLIFIQGLVGIFKA